MDSLKGVIRFPDYPRTGISRNIIVVLHKCILGEIFVVVE